MNWLIERFKIQNVRQKIYLIIELLALLFGFGTVIYFLTGVEWKTYDRPLTYSILEIELIIIVCMSPLIAAFVYFIRNRNQIVSLNETILMVLLSVSPVLIFIFYVFLQMLNFMNTNFQPN